jgi:ketosteroid isomerase-like protein
VEQPGNAEVVSRIIAAISGRDLDGVLAETHPERELTPMVTAWPEPYRGHDGIRRWFANATANWERFEIEIDAGRELDDETVLSIVRWRGRPRGSSEDLDGPAAAIWRMRAGKALSATVYPDEGRALAGVQRSAERGT